MSYEQYRPNKFNLLPPVIKNLLIINGLFFLATIVFQGTGSFDLHDKLGLHFPTSEKFQPYQIITHLFLHANFMHIFFNMFALWMFGNSLENAWGPKRFLIFYVVTGIGAAVCHYLVYYFVDLKPVLDEIDSLASSQPELFDIREKILNAPVAYGASGSVYGVLLAFGMMFPNTIIYIYFAIPMKAKWFVMLYGAVELFSGLKGSAGDNVAHFAHLGGMLFGYLLIKYWQKNKNRFY